MPETNIDQISELTGVSTTVISNNTFIAEDTTANIKADVISLIVNFYKQEDIFLTTANEFLKAYDAYYSLIHYDMKYLKNLMKNKVIRGTENE